MRVVRVPAAFSEQETTHADVMIACPGAQLILSMADAAGNAGGVATALYTVSRRYLLAPISFSLLMPWQRLRIALVMRRIQRPPCQ